VGAAQTHADSRTEDRHDETPTRCLRRDLKTPKTHSKSDQAGLH
jgi:hypothetical protein